jgi:hypothetical protein
LIRAAYKERVTALIQLTTIFRLHHATENFIPGPAFSTIMTPSKEETSKRAESKPRGIQSYRTSRRQDTLNLDLFGRFCVEG